MKRIFRWLCGIAALLFAAGILLIGSFIYSAEYQITAIDSELSADGRSRMIFQNVGGPDQPHGASHGRIVLKRDGRIVDQCRFDVANGGGLLLADNWKVKWREDSVEVTVFGEEQQDVCYLLYFDGKPQEE